MRGVSRLLHFSVQASCSRKDVAEPRPCGPTGGVQGRPQTQTSSAITPQPSAAKQPSSRGATLREDFVLRPGRRPQNSDFLGPWAVALCAEASDSQGMSGAVVAMIRCPGLAEKAQQSPLTFLRSFPSSTSQLGQAGIQVGDRLVSVNGKRLQASTRIFPIPALKRPTQLNPAALIVVKPYPISSTGLPRCEDVADCVSMGVVANVEVPTAGRGSWKGRAFCRISPVAGGAGLHVQDWKDHLRGDGFYETLGPKVPCACTGPASLLCTRRNGLHPGKRQGQ